MFKLSLSDATLQGEDRKTALSVRRGVCMRCPNCGSGKLFARYLKPVTACASCGENWSAVRADDGPAWLTILIVGHLVAPVLIEIIRNPERPLWVGLIAIPLLAGALSIALLQPVKGLWMGIIWANRVPTS